MLTLVGVKFSVHTSYAHVSPTCVMFIHEYICNNNNLLSASLVAVGTTMTFVSAVDNAIMGSELELREEHCAAVLIVYPFIVPKENGTLVIQQDEHGHHNDNGKA